MATEKEKLWLKRARAEHGNQTTQDKLESERDRHLATLKRVEWCDTNQFHFEKENRYYSLPCCPVCGRGKRWNEHKPDCRIDADLKRLEGE